MASKITTPLMHSSTNSTNLHKNHLHKHHDRLKVNASIAILPHQKASTVAPKVMPNPPLATKWREIQGSNDWDELINPNLNPLLRQEIVRYGEFVIACYQAFDLDHTSKRYLQCKFSKSTMLEKVGLQNSGYEVTKYIYATPDIDMPSPLGQCKSHWIGYVAVSNDEQVRKLGRRDILISFRGTVTHTEWIANFMSSLTPARLNPNDPKPDSIQVESGFLSLYTSNDRRDKFNSGSCREQVLSEVSRLKRMYEGEELSVTLAGHSMGSSLATLVGYDLAELGLVRPDESPITVYSYGGPRVGNLGFKKRCEELGVKVLRVVNVHDPVTKMPGFLGNEKFRFPWKSSCYVHVGVELGMDFFRVRNPACVHDLETYIGFLKCSKVGNLDGGADGLVNKVSRIINEQFLGAFVWQDALIQFGNLVQALSI